MFIQDYDEFCIGYTKRNKPFKTIKITFNYKSDSHDKLYLDTVIKEGITLSKHVNKGAANNTTSRRSNNILIINAVAGVLAEKLRLKILNDNGIDASSTTFTGAKNQIDIQILPSHATLEVRSSFPRNGITFSICHPKYQFDVLGPYSNNYKIGEIDKDFYVRTLFPFDVKGFPRRIKEDKFEVYLVGGATLDMMKKNGIEKDLIPDGEFISSKKSKYLTIPIGSALDVYGIIDEIKRQNN